MRQTNVLILVLEDTRIAPGATRTAAVALVTVGPSLKPYGQDLAAQELGRGAGDSRFVRNAE